jgi:hypothetical protein
MNHDERMAAEAAQIAHVKNSPSATRQKAARRDPRTAALEESDRALQQLFNDPAASHWLKEAARSLTQRDALDASIDADALAHLMRARFNALLSAARS